jgi:hypothetical protein
MKLPLVSKLVILPVSMVSLHAVVMKRLLLQGEKVWADGGYRGDPLKKVMGRGRARHELSIADSLLGLL